MERAQAGKRSSICYFIHINFPFVYRGADPSGLLERAAAQNPIEDVGGRFIHRRVIRDKQDLCLFQFNNSIAVSKAKFTDFTITQRPRDADEILPPAEIKIQFDFKLVTLVWQEE